MSQWLDFWLTSNEYREEKIKSFNLVDQFLTQAPKNILDIGCGIAFESREFNKKYNTELWLLDGDAADNNKRTRDIRFGSTESMMFYNTLDAIKDVLISDNITNYHLLNANNVAIPDDTKFDVICSWFSCGFHYPLESYRELILKHSHADTQLIFDLRKKNVHQHNVKILKVLEEGEKHIKALIQF